MQAFADICAVPHESGNRKGITQHFVDWANKHKFPVTVDEADNIVIKVPATPGYEKTPIICM